MATVVVLSPGFNTCSLCYLWLLFISSASVGNGKKCLALKTVDICRIWEKNNTKYLDLRIFLHFNVNLENC